MASGTSSKPSTGSSLSSTTGHEVAGVEVLADVAELFVEHVDLAAEEGRVALGRLGVGDGPERRAVHLLDRAEDDVVDAVGAHGRDRQRLGGVLRLGDEVLPVREGVLADQQRRRHGLHPADGAQLVGLEGGAAGGDGGEGVLDQHGHRLARTAGRASRSCRCCRWRPARSRPGCRCRAARPSPAPSREPPGPSRRRGRTGRPAPRDARSCRLLLRSGVVDQAAADQGQCERPRAAASAAGLREWSGTCLLLVGVGIGAGRVARLVARVVARVVGGRGR